MRFYWVFAGIAVFTSTALADPARDALKEISKCAEVAGAADRLKCFDAALPGAQTALSAPEPAPGQTAQTTEEGGVMGWFGFQRPVTKPEDFGKPRTPVASAHELTSINANVVEFATNGLGRSIFILDNGQVWKQIDGDTTVLSGIESGDTMKVTVSTGIFGGYNLEVEGRNTVIKVHRLK